MTTNWRPISEFKPESHDEADFLIWLPIPNTGPNGESGAPFIAQWHEDNMFGDPGFTGEWRHIEEFEELEPVAFAMIDPCTLFDGEKLEEAA